MRRAGRARKWQRVDGMMWGEESYERDRGGGDGREGEEGYERDGREACEKGGGARLRMAVTRRRRRSVRSAIATRSAWSVRATSSA